jgi:hypothetical protein
MAFLADGMDPRSLAGLNPWECPESAEGFDLEGQGIMIRAVSTL